MSVAIEVKNLSKIYTIYENSMVRLKDALGFSKENHGREFYALDHISFSVEKGKTLGIIGENGAGKSTLLKIITGVLAPSEGEVIINGRVSALLELGTGFNPEYTGIENIYLSGNIMGLSRKEIDEKVQDILDFADIGNFVNQKVKTYSSGMFARLAFAVAINVEPEILIVDEALAVGDLFFQQKCNMYMKEKMNSCTKLLVTHDMASIANMADEVIVISKGKQVFYGEPLQAIEYYTKKAHTEVFQEVRNERHNDDGNSGEKNADRPPVESSEIDAGWEQDDDWILMKDDNLGGALEARIEGCHVLINEEEYKGYVQNDDVVRVDMLIRTERKMKNVIIGYQMKDKYGNIIFGENTHSSGFPESTILPDGRYLATLSFKWPCIQENNYFLTLGLGEGNHEMQHIIQCWAHSIFEFRNITNLPNHGLFNQKIDEYKIQRVKNNA
ncbi:MAG: ABC transporter ATP-binding protein [Lachnospiraceae bacterium]|nr:ABC transporter ATP-binding protein [Lachnospiraceae bacterium]